MPVSTIGSIAGLNPSFELSEKDRSSNGRQAVAKQIAAMPARNRGNSELMEPVPNRMATNIADYGLAFNRRLQFVVDHRSNEVLVKVISKTTDEPVKESPKEGLRHLYGGQEGDTGFLLSRQA